MGVKLKQFKAGDIHPNGYGWYGSEAHARAQMSEREAKIKWPNKASLPISSGSTLRGEAWIWVWEDETPSEWGPVTP